jgi:hypothetical protein
MKTETRAIYYYNINSNEHYLKYTFDNENIELKIVKMLCVSFTEEEDVTMYDVC